VFVLLRRANSAHGWHASGKPALAQPLRVFVRVIEVCRFSLLSIAYKIRMFIMNRKRMRRASSLSALPTSSAGHGADGGKPGAAEVWKVNPIPAHSTPASSSGPPPSQAAQGAAVSSTPAPSLASRVAMASAAPSSAASPPHAAPVAAARPATASVGGAAPLPGSVYGAPPLHAAATAPPTSTPTAPPAAPVGGYGAAAPGRRESGVVGAKGGYAEVQESSKGGYGAQL
jgi:hypothetical protein